MFRRIRRAVALAFILAFCVVRYWLERIRRPMTLERRALWLQQSARGVLGCLDIDIQFEGQPVRARFPLKQQHAVSGLRKAQRNHRSGWLTADHQVLCESR